MSGIPKEAARERVLVFAPHPDDDIIGCGGSIAKHIQQGREVTVVYMTSGESGSTTCPKIELAKIRTEEAVQAAKILGLGEQDLVFLGKPDGYLLYSKDNIIELITLIRDKRPNLVYMPHQNDLHKDHVVTHELAAEACRRSGGPWFQECTGQPWNVENILGYEVWTPLQELSYIEDISDYMEIKLEALNQHESQLRDIQYEEGIKGLNQYRGIMTGKGNYCECFQVMRISRIF